MLNHLIISSACAGHNPQRSLNIKLSGNKSTSLIDQIMDISKSIKPATQLQDVIPEVVEKASCVEPISNLKSLDILAELKSLAPMPQVIKSPMHIPDSDFASVEPKLSSLYLNMGQMIETAQVQTEVQTTKLYTSPIIVDPLLTFLSHICCAHTALLSLAIISFCSLVTNRVPTFELGIINNLDD